MRDAKQKQRDLLLTTLIDLLVQILFLFLVIVAIVSLSSDKLREKAEQAQKAEKELGFPLQTIVERWHRLVDPDKLQEEIKQFRAKIADYERLRRLEAQLTSRETLVKEQEKILGNALGRRPCWGDRTQVDGIFRIRLSDNGILVSRAWPPSKEIEASSLPIPQEALDRILGVDAFRAAFNKLSESSQRQNCVHYVSIEDATLSAARSHDLSQAVEGYFYLLGKRRVAQ